MAWQYTDSSNTVAWQSDPGGSVSSVLASSLPEGTAIAAAAPPVVQVPQTVTRFQAIAAMNEAGLLTAVKAIFADPQTPVLATLAWENASEFKRTSPTLLQLAPLLGLDSSALDALFTRAAAIDA